MTRNEYLESLNSALQFLEADVRQAAVVFYAEMLDDRMEDGLSEEEAVRAMEDVQTIAQRMRSEQPVRVSAEKTEAKKSAYSQCTITYGTADLASLTTRFYDRPVIVEPGEGQELVISYMEDESLPIEYTEENGHLKLVEQKPRKNALTIKGLFGFSFGSILDSIVNGGERCDLTVRIQVPMNSLIALDIKTSNGKITMQNLQGLGNVALHSTNGGIALADLKIKDLEAHTTNGRITLTHAASANCMTATTTNSSIHADNCHSCSTLTLRSSNAHIQAENTCSDSVLNISTTNGGIRVAALAAPALSMATTNGSISGTLPGRQKDYYITSHTVNGHNSLPPFQEGETRLAVKTTNGSIRLTFDQD